MSAAESRYTTIDRADWAALRAATPLTLRQDDLDKLRGINDQIDLEEVAAIYLPLSRLLNLRVSASQELARVSSTFLGQMAPRVPYVIGVAGSVAVGKSTFARILQALLSRWPDHPDVDLVTTDGFLYPNAVLEERGLMSRKGFPESYDTRRLLAFLRDVKSGADEVRAPVYSHVIYDVLDDAETIVRQPDILILEGLNVLQVGSHACEFVSDYFDFSIYIDAEESDILSLVHRPLHGPARVGVQGPQQLLPALRRPQRRGRVADGDDHLARHQRPQPAREHPADARTGVADPVQGRRPSGHQRAPPQAVAVSSWSSCSRAARGAGGRPRPEQIANRIGRNRGPST